MIVLLLVLLVLCRAAAGAVRLASTVPGSMLLQERPSRLEELWGITINSSSSR
jgi:hypothetical protein